MKEPESKGEVTKSSALIWLTILTWIPISIGSWRLFAVSLSARYDSVTLAALELAHLPWTIFWLWAIHNFWHQILSCLRSRSLTASPNPSGEIVILYTTCDDFEPRACLSCLQQTYSRSRLIICDDSTDERYRETIDAWAAQFGPRVSVTRRPSREGFKASNLNYVLQHFAHEEFIVICDADEIIPSHFVSSLLGHLQSSSAAFAQARHQVNSPPATRFAGLLGEVTNIFFDYCLPLRNRFGFVSCFGHGVIIRRSVWKAIGGFPVMTSEDLAFASRALAEGFRGVYVEHVTAAEAYPPTYTALVKKYRRVTEGTIEYFHHEFPRLLRSSKATWTEKLDLLITYSSSYVGLVSMINFMSGVVVILLNKISGYEHLRFSLLIIYLIGPFTPVSPMIVRTPRAPLKYISLFLAAAMTYASLLPVLAVRALAQMLRQHAPLFEPTGKVGRQSQRIGDHLLTECVGILILCLALATRSLALVPAASLGLMFVLGPLLCLSERTDTVGLLVRNSGLIPYIFMVALYFWWN